MLACLLPPTEPLHEQTEADGHKTIAVDVTGVFLAMKYELDHMVKAGRGSIINTTSVAGLRGGLGMAPNVAAKHAVVGLSKAAALDYATQGIRVTAIAPGLVRRPITERWLKDPLMSALVLADSPIRCAAAEEFADLVLFRASGQASVIIGAIYPIDGAHATH